MANITGTSHLLLGLCRHSRFHRFRFYFRSVWTIPNIAVERMGTAAAALITPLVWLPRLCLSQYPVYPDWWLFTDWWLHQIRGVIVWKYNLCTQCDSWYILKNSCQVLPSVCPSTPSTFMRTRLMIVSDPASIFARCYYVKTCVHNLILEIIWNVTPKSGILPEHTQHK